MSENTFPQTVSTSTEASLGQKSLRWYHIKSTFDLQNLTAGRSMEKRGKERCFKGTALSSMAFRALEGAGDHMGPGVLQSPSLQAQQSRSILPRGAIPGFNEKLLFSYNTGSKSLSALCMISRIPRMTLSLHNIYFKHDISNLPFRGHSAAPCSRSRYASPTQPV